MQITTISYFGSSREKLKRLGLAEPLLELQQLIVGAAAAIDMNSRISPSLTLSRTYSASSPRLGVISLLATRRERIIARILRLRNAVQRGAVDAGVVIVAADRLAGLLPTRTAVLSELLRLFEYELPEASRVAILVMAVEGEGAVGGTSQGALSHTGAAEAAYTR